MKKFEAIESLRGWMAWWVVLGHSAILFGGSRQFLGYTLSHLLEQVALAVDVFMIVSGFVIAHLLMGRDEQYLAYIARRWFRLMPLFTAMLALAIVTKPLYAIAFIENPFVADKAMRIDRLELEMANWVLHLPLHLSLLHGVIPDTVLKYSGSAFLSPAWSLSLEWQFYLAAPFLLLAARKLRWIGVAAAVIIVGWLGLHGALGEWQYPSFLPLKIVFFFIGITSRQLLDRKIPLVAIAITSVAAVAYLAGSGLRVTVGPFLFVTAIWSVFLFITARETGIVKVRSKALDLVSWLIALNPISVALGRVSYSTYLSHIPIFAIVLGLGMPVLGNDRATVLGLTFAAVATAAVASFMLYKFVESPGVSLGNRWLRRRPVDELAAA